MSKITEDDKQSLTRREFLRKTAKAAYIAPTLTVLSITPKESQALPPCSQLPFPGANPNCQD